MKTKTKAKAKRKFRVIIYEQPFEYDVEAKTPEQAELKAFNEHNGGNYDEVCKTEIKEIDESGDEVDIPDIGDAEHPHRKKAIRIIEQVIEPLLERIKNNADKKWELSGEAYYELEDELTELINK